MTPTLQPTQSLQLCQCFRKLRSAHDYLQVKRKEPTTRFQELRGNPSSLTRLTSSTPPFYLRCALFIPSGTQPQRSPFNHSIPVEPLGIGDRVIFMDDDRSRSGMVMALETKDKRTIVVISPDLTQDGSDPIRIPLESVIREELLTPGVKSSMPLPLPWHNPISGLFSAAYSRLFKEERLEPPSLCPNSTAHLGATVASAGMARDVSGSHHLTLNSVVEVELTANKTVFGTVRWIGKLEGMEGIRVGLELEEPTGFNDGTFSGQRLFQCAPNRGIFVKLDSCRPDSRFQFPGDR